jgi:hypothetical protein
MFVDEIEHFLSCVDTGKDSDIPLEAGRNVLRVALAAKEAYCA